MTMWISLVCLVLALSHRTFGSVGDVCYVLGAQTCLVDDQLYFMGGNYSIVTYDGQAIEPTASLYSIDLNSQFPVERAIPQAALNNETIDSKTTVAYRNAVRAVGVDTTNGAVWPINDTLYVFGGGFETPTNTLSAYNVSTGTWKDVTVAGGDFNFAQRTAAQVATAPESGLGFIFGGNTPYMSGMIRFDASNPDNLVWTNETLSHGSKGVQVPNLVSGALVYIPAGKEGMLISFGGANVTQGISPFSGWPYDADWLTIYVYDIASHTWWAQEASGSPPSNRGAFCAVVTTSPDNGAFHITTYGGWSLADQRSYEDVNILSIPSFTWIDATELSDQTNKEQQVNSNIGRDALSGACQAYRGSQMIVLGGEIRAGADSLTNGACSNVFEPVRVLDLSTYKWQTELNTSSTYEVPAVIYDTIGGDAKGGATATIPSAGFADSMLASLIKERVSTVSTVSSPTNTVDQSESGPSSTPEQNKKSSHSNTGAIAGGVVGGVVGLALILGAAWLLFRRRRGRGSKGEGSMQVKKNPSQMQELGVERLYEAPTYGARSEMSGEGTAELPGTTAVAELGSNVHPKAARSNEVLHFGTDVKR